MLERRIQETAWKSLLEQPELTTIQSFADGKTKQAIAAAKTYLDLIGPAKDQLEAGLYLALECKGLFAAQIWQAVYLAVTPILNSTLAKFADPILDSTFAAQANTWEHLSKSSPFEPIAERVVLAEWVSLLQQKTDQARKKLLGISGEEKEAGKLYLLACEIVLRLTSAAHLTMISRDSFPGGELIQVHELVATVAELKWQLNKQKPGIAKAELYQGIYQQLMQNQEFAAWAREPQLINYKESYPWDDLPF